MPQAPSPPTTQEKPRTEPLTHPITTMELPPQHRTTLDRKGFRDLPREWTVHNGTLRWDEITPGLQAICLHSITEPTTSWAPPTGRYHLLLTVQGDATITPTEGDPVTAAPAHAVHKPPQAFSAPMTVHPGPTPWQAIVITYPAPNDHTHTWQQRWEDIRGDLLQDNLGLTRTHHTLHPIRGVGQAPHGIHIPGVWAYTTPMNPQAAEDTRTALFIQQAQTQTPHRNTQRGYTIWWAYQDHNTLTPLPGAPPLDTNTTALLQAAAAAATQVGASETWGPQYLVETKVAPHAKAQDKPPTPKPLHPPLKLDPTEHTPQKERGTHYIILHTTTRKNDAAKIIVTHHLPHTTQVYELTAPNVLVTLRRHDERYTIQAEGAAATGLYTWATRGHLPHPTLHHTPSWPTPFHTADRPNKKPRHTDVHTPAQEAQHRHDAWRKARILHDDHTIPRISAPPARVSDASPQPHDQGHHHGLPKPSGVAGRRREHQRRALPHTGGGAPPQHPTPQTPARRRTLRRTRPPCTASTTPGVSTMTRPAPPHAPRPCVNRCRPRLSRATCTLAPYRETRAYTSCPTGPGNTPSPSTV